MKVTVIALLLAIGIVYSCKKEESETIPVTFEDAVEVETDTISVKEVKVVDLRLWSNSETDLPVGEVVDYDCANLGEKTQNMRDNYVLIRKPDNVFTIKRDIDIDFFCCIKKGDRIIE